MGNKKERNITKIQSAYVQQKEQMQQQQMKKRRGLVRRLTLFGVIAFILSVVSISTLFSQASTIKEKQEMKEEVENELISLEKEEQLLEEEILKLNDDGYIAKLARREYYLSTKGEVIFNLPENEEEKD